MNQLEARRRDVASKSARSKDRRPKKAAYEKEDGDGGGPRPGVVWKGALAFGLVNVPVEVFSALRRQPIQFRTIDDGGTPLKRQYYCPQDEQALDADEIVRGYQRADGDPVAVSAEELDALEPNKSREIDLHKFVPLGSIPSIFLKHPYVIAPAGESTKAYRLLAAAMAQSQRMGIATFVMRGTEYLIAVFARDGILRAQTLHFQEEVRKIADVDPTALALADRNAVAALIKEMKNDEAETYPLEQLHDAGKDQLAKLIAKKRKTKTDWVEPAAALSDPQEKVIDLMPLLKARISRRK